jgi:hypothetical protein
MWYVATVCVCGHTHFFLWFFSFAQLNLWPGIRAATMRPRDEMHVAAHLVPRVRAAVEQVNNIVVF